MCGFGLFCFDTVVLFVFSCCLPILFRVCFCGFVCFVLSVLIPLAFCLFLYCHQPLFVCAVLFCVDALAHLSVLFCLRLFVYVFAPFARRVRILFCLVVFVCVHLCVVCVCAGCLTLVFRVFVLLVLSCVGLRRPVCVFVLVLYWCALCYPGLFVASVFCVCFVFVIVLFCMGAVCFVRFCLFRCAHWDSLPALCMCR